MDLLDALDQTFGHAHGVIARVRPDQYDDATPCSEWTVRELLEHLVGVVAGIGWNVSGERPAAPFELAPDPAAQFTEAAAFTLAAWAAPGALDRMIEGPPGPMPGRALANINLLDTATHTWDLAIATGQPAVLPEDVAAAALEASLQTISPEIRAGRFGPAVDAADARHDTDRLVAFLGRQPRPSAASSGLQAP
jgi:uncharacterized protein (TIGR03086 family)